MTDPMSLCWLFGALGFVVGMLFTYFVFLWARSR